MAVRLLVVHNKVFVCYIVCMCELCLCSRWCLVVFYFQFLLVWISYCGVKRTKLDTLGCWDVNSAVHLDLRTSVLWCQVYENLTPLTVRGKQCSADKKRILRTEFYKRILRNRFWHWLLPREQRNTPGFICTVVSSVWNLTPLRGEQCGTGKNAYYVQVFTNGQARNQPHLLAVKSTEL